MSSLIQQKWQRPTRISSPGLLIILLIVDFLFLLIYFKTDLNNLFQLSGFFKSSETDFIDVSSSIGLRQHGTTGASWVDYNNDGYLDILVNSNLYTNVHGEKFISNLDNNGLKRNLWFSLGVFGDYDNDGCPDLYIVNNGPQFTLDSVGEQDTLYHNNCNGTFTDVTKIVGIEDSFHGTGASWADYNNDGYLDLYVSNWGVTPERNNIKNYKFEPNILYRNNGNGTFTNVTRAAGVIGGAKCDNLNINTGDEKGIGKTSYQPIWFDYNNDGYQDLFVATDTTISPLYRNDKDGRFSDVTQMAGLCRFGTGMGATAGDYDNDGYLDLYVTNTGINYLWHNNRDGTFSEVSEKAKIIDLGQGWGTNFFDFDNDGNLDLYVVNGADDPDLARRQNVDLTNIDNLYLNNGHGRFTKITEKAVLTFTGIKRSAAFADYNGDGFIDVYVTIMKVPENRFNFLYKNTPNGNHWLTIQLIGTKSNRDAVGARITVKTGNKSQIREVISGSSFLSQNSLWQTFGFGKSKIVDKIEIRWPSGLVQSLHNVKTDQKIVVVEKN